MNQYIMPFLVLGALFCCSKGGLATPASTEYVNQHISDAVRDLTSVLKKEVGQLATQINKQNISFHEVGERYQGGIIFFVDESKLHGLIAAMKDANNGEGVQWKNGESGEKVVNARANGLGAGESNTRLIIAQQTIDYQEGNFAALAALNYSVSADGTTPCGAYVSQGMTCYGDWYLPSLYELTLMHANCAQSMPLLPALYWSSTEANVSESWAHNAATGEHQLLDKSMMAPKVRPIRAF